MADTGHRRWSPAAAALATRGLKRKKKSTQFINLVLLSADVLAADVPGADGPRSNIVFGLINVTLLRTDVTILL